MKHLIRILGIVFLLSVFGCKQNTEQRMSFAAEEMVIESKARKPLPNKELGIERKLIKKGTIKFETDDLNITKQSILKAVESHNGYISSDEESNYQYEKSNSLVVRVPAENFDQLLNDISKGVKKFDRKEVNLKDVTEEFLDVQARLKTKKELEKRYLELLNQANSVIEILEIEKQIGKLRSEIESTEGRLEYLNNQISISTLYIEFYVNIPQETELGKQFKGGFKKGWENLMVFFVFLINIWPFLLIGIGLFYGIRKYRRKNK